MYTKKEIDQDRERIKNGLKQYRGAVAEIVARTTVIRPSGYSRAYVDYVLRGKRSNTGILEIAAEVLVEYQEREQNRRMRVRQLSGKIAMATA